MTEQKEKKSATNDPRYVVLGTNGKVESRRYHVFADCSFIADDDAETITERESKLLGLKVCSVCERRQTGGPALDALKDLFDVMPVTMADVLDVDQAAWYVMNGLKKQGFYIARKGAKS